MAARIIDIIIYQIFGHMQQKITIHNTLNIHDIEIVELI